VRIPENVHHFLKQKNNLYLLGAAILTIALLAGLISVFLTGRTPKPQPVKMINTVSSDSIIIINDSLVPPVIYKKMPDLTELSIKKRKHTFMNVMLPTILTAKEIIEEHRQSLLHLKKKKGYNADDSLFIQKMKKRLRSDDIDEMIHRLHPQPVSIILAQTAIESGWGTSRFCREANNLFGIWSFSASDKRIAAAVQRNDKTIYLKKYDSLTESLIDYLYTIGRSTAFIKFREIRAKSQNTYRLIWFLDKYSEKRMSYIVTLRNTIEKNDLTKFDSYRLMKVNKRDSTWTKLIEKY